MSVSELDTALLAEEEEKSLEAREFGFWVYLMTDAIIFALLFATYVVMVDNIAAGPSGKEVFDLTHAAIETGLLLLSSLTFGFATISLGEKRPDRVILWLVVSLALGLGFLVMEIMEFAGMIAQGAGPQESGFLSAFFTLVATHGLHVTFGSIGIVVMIGQVMVKGLTRPVTSRIFRLGLFWHFLEFLILLSRFFLRLSFPLSPR